MDAIQKPIPEPEFNDDLTDIQLKALRAISPVLPDIVETRSKSDNTPFNSNYILYWNFAGLELNRLTHSLHNKDKTPAPQSGPPISARTLGILQLAIHDAYFAIHAPTGFGLFLTPDPNVPDLPPLPDKSGANDSRQAVAGAAKTVLDLHYAQSNPNLDPDLTRIFKRKINDLLHGFGGVNISSASYKFGEAVGKAIFQYLYHPNGAATGSYEPKHGQKYYYDEDPTNPGQKHHGPFYGTEAKRFATQNDHLIADPPGIPNLSAASQTAEYDDALKDVHRMGGKKTLSTCKRAFDQDVGSIYWTYDGANLIGTPPRLYNQIIRRIAVGRAEGELTSEANNATFARLLALTNVAMADAGIFAWKEKYKFEVWRPISGVRNDGRKAFADPFWLSQGAPATNSFGRSFKPPFPAYPSGHATFGAACFQIVRLFYDGGVSPGETPWKSNEPDQISFELVSDEMNGKSRDLYQEYIPSKRIEEQSGDVRTHVSRKFGSLWEAIWENALSRVWLGVHWRFDACGASDVLIPSAEEGVYATDSAGSTIYQNIEDVRFEATGARSEPEYQGRKFPVGGIGLGLEIANELWATQLKATPATMQPKTM
ncbi:vanadium chloroperoxidase [Microthyrium microscopicum]|uniref:Vanadium chloroperoxidase n=1 Tax=Microthyrium microscopicum TaxID=703497 RepID=A0A6A6U3N1_9PEZI|nr:vanadium chloroperoxidase [Microthyrium microscopicum]